jgi:signal transduction histidine kinase
MNRARHPHGYRGGYLVGFILIGVVAVRAILFYRSQPSFDIVLSLIGLYALFYSLEPWLSDRFPWSRYIYFPLQTALVIVLSQLKPFLDFLTILYFPLSLQVVRAFPRRVAMIWMIFFALMLGVTLIPGMGLWEGLALILLEMASITFLISYDSLYLQTQADQAKSQRLLADLQVAHQKLHDSVSQVIFSITLTSQSARLLLERDPARVPTEIERLQEMTSSALNQLRSLIAELRPVNSKQ